MTTVLQRFTTDGAAQRQPEAIHAACEAVGDTAWRDRLLKPVITVQWLRLQILQGHTACRHLPHLAGCSCRASASCQARAKLPIRGLAYRLARCGQSAQATLAAAGRWYGQRTFCVDGSGGSMPDTPGLQAACGPPSEPRPGCGVPVARLLALVHAGPGLFTQLSSAPVLTPELAHGQHGHPAWAPGDVLVADRGMCASAHLAMRVQRGMPAVFRIGSRQMVDFTPHHPLVMPATRRSAAIKGRPRSRWISAFSTDDARVEWVKPRTCPPWLRPDAREALPPALVGRELRDDVTRRGFRARQMTRVTTWREAACYPRADLAERYRTRGDADTHLAPLKTPRKMAVRHGQTVLGVHKARLILAILDHLVRLVMLPSAIQPQVDVERSSLLDAWRWLGAPDPGVPLERLLVNPVRPHRVEPRVNKRRPKAFPFMSKPRRLLRPALIQHALGA